MGSRSLLPLLALAGAVLAGATAAAAPEEAFAPPAPDALAVPYKGWKVRALVIEGLEPDLANRLRRGLALTPPGGLSLAKKPTLFPRLLEEDLARSRLFLARAGFPDARVTPALDPDEGKRQVTIRLRVDPGPARVLEQVRLEGFPPDLAPPLRPKALALGRTFADAPVQGYVADLEAALRRHGYAKGTAVPRLEATGDHGIVLVFAVESGVPYVFDEVRVSGCREDLRPLALRTVDTPPGTPYSPATLRAVEERLRLLGLFRRVRLDVKETGPGTLALTVDIVERELRTLEAGLGYWTDEQFRPHGRWQHRNLFHRGRGAEVRGSYTRFLREGATSVWWPALLGPRTQVSTSLAVEQQLEDSYELLDTKLTLSSLYRRSMLTSFRTGVELARVGVDATTVDSTAFLEEGGLLTTGIASWARDSSDDRLDPSNGTLAWANARSSIPSLSDAQFVSLETGASVYRALRPDWVAAAHTVVGVARPFGSSPDLLPNHRFYAGGARSMRGFARRRLGPVDASGAPLGGEAKIEMSLEVRYPVWRRLRGAAFVDAGQVFERRGDFDLGALEYAVGPGLMVRTPIGPLRADWGVRLTDRDPTAPEHVFHLSIGHPY